MNRRDVIIIAVLVNAGLLVVLFASALKSGNNQPEIAVQKEAPNAAPVVVQNESRPARGDEVDQVLSQFTTNSTSTSSTAIVTPVLQPLPSAPGSTPLSDMSSPLPSFTDDMNSLAPAQTLSISPPASEIKPDSSFKEVKVKKGDALEKIARTHQTSVQEIMRANRLTSTQLKIGQVLKIPSKNSKGSGSSSASSSTVSSNSAEAKYYTVKNGDNPWTIAVKNHLKVDELLKLNNLDEERARKLKPGDQLRIR